MRVTSICVIFVFLFTSLVPAQAQMLESGPVLPLGGAAYGSPLQVMPPAMRGLTINPDNPFEFNFIIHPGDAPLADDEFQQESMQLVKYFMAALTVPEDELWVNLSPDEPDRIMPGVLSQTAMGRDLLAQDYILKQLSAAMMSPEGEVGKKFWQKIFDTVGHDQDVGNVPMNILSRIWIVPESASVYEYGQSVFVAQRKLKVMVENDYKISRRGGFQIHPNKWTGLKPVPTSMSTVILGETIIPAIEHEVNEGANFANLRQIYDALILATWYKKKLVGAHCNTPLCHYIDQNNVKGIADARATKDKQKIYKQYLQAFKNGAYDFIKEDYDPAAQEVKHTIYFSGGADFAMTEERIDRASDAALTVARKVLGALEVKVAMGGVSGQWSDVSGQGGDPNAAMRASDPNARFEINFERAAQLTAREISQMTTREFLESITVSRQGRKLWIMDLAADSEFKFIKKLFNGHKEILDPEMIDSVYGMDQSRIVKVTKQSLRGEYGFELELVGGEALYNIGPYTQNNARRLTQTFSNDLKFDLMTINAPWFDTLRYIIEEADAFTAKGGVVLIRLEHKEQKNAEHLIKQLSDKGFAFLGWSEDHSPKDFPDSGDIQNKQLISAGIQPAPLLPKDRSIYVFIKGVAPQGYVPFGSLTPGRLSDAENLDFSNVFGDTRSDSDISTSRRRNSSESAESPAMGAVKPWWEGLSQTKKALSILAAALLSGVGWWALFNKDEYSPPSVDFHLVIHKSAKDLEDSLGPGEYVDPFTWNMPDIEASFKKAKDENKQVTVFLENAGIGKASQFKEIFPKVNANRLLKEADYQRAFKAFYQARIKRLEEMDNARLNFWRRQFNTKSREQVAKKASGLSFGEKIIYYLALAEHNTGAEIKEIKSESVPLAYFLQVLRSSHANESTTDYYALEIRDKNEAGDIHRYIQEDEGVNIVIIRGAAHEYMEDILDKKGMQVKTIRPDKVKGVIYFFQDRGPVKGGFDFATRQQLKEIFRPDKGSPAMGAGRGQWSVVSSQPKEIDAAMAFQKKYATYLKNLRKRYRGITLSAQSVNNDQRSEVSGHRGNDDAAMSNQPGGIDLNPAQLNLERKGEGARFAMPELSPEQIESIRLNGLTPVIINITPLTNIPLLLGITEKEDLRRFSRIQEDFKKRPLAQVVNDRNPERYEGILSLN